MLQKEKSHITSMADEENTQYMLFKDGSGPVPYKLTNDYLFRAVFQTNPKALKGLVAALLHLEDSEITSIHIENPIELGTKIENKDFVLDIKLTLNDYSVINLEMQVRYQDFWKERSLCYTCRTFDSLNKGDLYEEVQPVIHIAFLDFPLFPEKTEFYGTYKIMNVKNLQVYSDKFTISVVDLNHIELATEEDKFYKIDYWARLFKATTWEEIKMLADDCKALIEAANTMYTITAEERIRQQCEAREENERIERTRLRLMAKAEAKAEEAVAKLEEAEAKLKEAEEMLAKTIEENARMKAEMQAKLDAMRAEVSRLQAESEKSGLTE